MPLNCVVIHNTFIHLFIFIEKYIFFGLPKLVNKKIMASKEEMFNLTAHREVLRSFSLSDTKMSVEQNLQCACTNHDSIMHQQVAVEDAPEMA